MQHYLYCLCIQELIIGHKIPIVLLYNLDDSYRCINYSFIYEERYLITRLLIIEKAHYIFKMI